MQALGLLLLSKTQITISMTVEDFKKGTRKYTTAFVRARTRKCLLQSKYRKYQCEGKGA